MIPRGAPDIGWRDLAFAAWHTLRDDDWTAACRAAENAWKPAGHTLACLSVRSGFDLLLRALALPPGSEILVSAVTIPHMLELIELHGLRARPIDLDPATLSVDCHAVARAVTGRTRALLVAHLWGSRMPLDALAQLARRHGLLLLEDCAQAFDAQYRGHPGADVSMWSFGPIKSATALGGALLRFGDRGLLERARRLQAAYPQQSRRAYALRIARVAALKLLATPLAFGVFVALCRRRGLDHDALIHGALRSFSGGDLLPRLRLRPCAGLLRLLARRVGTADPASYARRTQRATRMYAMLPRVEYPGAAAPMHSYWMTPLLSPDPEQLVRHLWRRGFDATRSGSSLVIAAPAELSPRAARMLAQLVYLPVYPRLSSGDARRLCRAVLELENDPRRHAKDHGFYDAT